MKKFSDKQIREVLIQSADISRYSVCQPGDIYTASIHYRSEDGVLWSVINDDDDFADACLEYLVRHGVPVFSNVKQLIEYEC